MPMKAMIYKSLSTVVDDLFAYVSRLLLCDHMEHGVDGTTTLQVLYQDANAPSARMFPG